MNKIYLIDDDELYLKLMSKKLWERGYAVKTFLSVEQALPNLKETPDVIVLDHNFGYNESKGTDYIPILRMQAKHSSLLYVTSESSPAIINKSLNIGADRYIKKDKNIYDLVPGVIQSILDNKKPAKKSFWASIFR